MNEVEIILFIKLKSMYVGLLKWPFICIGFMNWFVFPINKLTHGEDIKSLPNVDYNPRDEIQLLMRLIATPECLC